MTDRVDNCLAALRLLARSPELEATRLLTAELQIRELLVPVEPSPGTATASLEELDEAITLEAELRPREASFWQGVRDYIAQRLAVLDFDEG
jgi:hypothetical protein